MQQHIKNLDGSSKGIQTLGSAYDTPQSQIDHAIEVAGSSPEGCFVIFGNDLDHEPSEQEVNVIAMGLPSEPGILFFQNVLDPE